MQRPSSRRSFLAKVVASAALVPAAMRSASGTAEAAGLPAPPGKDASADEAYWQQVRAQFAFLEAKVPMNAANLCPSPRAVAERVTELTYDIDRDCSFQNRAKFTPLREASREKVAAQLGVSPDEIALVRNTSEANNTVNNGIQLEEGDEVVLWDQNHPTNNVAWDVRAARFNLVVRRVSTPLAPKSQNELVDVFVNALGPKTKVLSITHVSNVSGIRLPAREICAAAKQRGIYVHVDGAQSWGALNVDLRELGCDSYSASAHKWFMGPKEAGVLFVKSDSIPRIWPNIVAPGWGDDVDPDPKGARKFESLGQRDDAAVAAIGTGVDFHAAMGQAQVEARMMALASALKNGIADAGFELVTPLDPELSGGVCIVKVPAGRRGPIMNAMYNDHGIACAGTGGLRLCPHVYNTMEHVERAVAGVTALQVQITG